VNNFFKHGKVWPSSEMRLFVSMVFTFFAAAERKHTETNGSNRTVGQGANSQGTETERRRWMVRS